jgi:hypothetical protein
MATCTLSSSTYIVLFGATARQCAAVESGGGAEDERAQGRLAWEAIEAE